MAMSQPDSRPVLERTFVVVVVCFLTIGFFYAMIPNMVRSRTSPANACINNMRQIQAAKNEWALENRISNNVVVTENDITPYIQLNSNSSIPPCPSGGTYTIGRVDELPTCSIGTNSSQPHILTLEQFEGRPNGGH